MLLKHHTDYKFKLEKQRVCALEGVAYYIVYDVIHTQYGYMLIQCVEDLAHKKKEQVICYMKAKTLSEFNLLI